jgi:hypothetical protein
VTSTNLRTEFLLQFRKQREDSAILLASNRPHNEDQTKKQRKTERERTGEDKEQVGLHEAPHLPDPKQNHSENAKSRNSKQEFFIKNQPSGSL